MRRRGERYPLPPWKMGTTSVASAMESATFTCTLVEANPAGDGKSLVSAVRPSFCGCGWWELIIRCSHAHARQTERTRSSKKCQHPSIPSRIPAYWAGVGSESSKHACKGDLCRFLFLREAEKAARGGWNGPNSNLNDVGEAEIHGNETGAAG